MTADLHESLHVRDKCDADPPRSDCYAWAAGFGSSMLASQRRLHIIIALVTLGTFRRVRTAAQTAPMARTRRGHGWCAGEIAKWSADQNSDLSGSVDACSVGRGYKFYSYLPASSFAVASTIFYEYLRLTLVATKVAPRAARKQAASTAQARASAAQARAYSESRALRNSPIKKSAGILPGSTQGSKKAKSRIRPKVSIFIGNAHLPGH